MRRERPALFKGRHFEPEIIILCVRRYLRYALSLRNVEEIMAERNIDVDHVTIWRWIQRYAPELSRRCRRELRKTNGSWRVDETYLGVAGKWTYLYRAVDSTGDTIDFLLSPTRDAGAAKRFFQRALQSPNHPRPRVVNVDRNPAHAYAAEHDRYYGVIHRVTRWFTELYLQQGPQAEARRERAFPRHAEDPMRVPDHIASGPDLPADDTVRRRFWGEC